MQDLRRDYTEPFTVKIARSVLAMVPTGDLAVFLSRHILQQPCEDRDARLVADAYLVSIYFRSGNTRLVLHTNRATHVTSVILLPDTQPTLRTLDRLTAWAG